MIKKQLRIGLDLDNTIYGFPEFFREFIPAMVAAGHKIYCTSNHFQSNLDVHIRRNLRSMGIDPAMLDFSLMQDGVDEGRCNKARMAKHCDFVFDDDGDILNKISKVPFFVMPKDKSLDRDGFRVPKE